MRCLSDVELHAIADGETHGAGKAGGAASHVRECPRCRARLDEIVGDLRDITAAVNVAEMPPRLDALVRESIASSGAVRGSTRLRAPGPSPAWRRPAFLLPLATAAVIALAVFGVIPRFGAPTTLSASQVLGRSLETLQKGQGVELLEYELVTSGATHGSWRIVLVVDHERPTRYRVTTLTPDGEVIAAFSQDPLRQRRSQLTRVDGRNYIVTVNAVPNPVLSLPQMAQALVETVIRAMQAASDPTLTTSDGPNGKQYIVDIPAVSTPASAATLDLQYARTVVSAVDFRIQEFQATGALLRQPFSVSFKLLNHIVAGDVSVLEDGPDGRLRTVELFEIAPGPNDVVLEGTATEHPGDELLTTLIRELARSRAF